jgi:hypothetical protein
MPSPEALERMMSDIRALALQDAWSEIEAVMRGLPQWLANAPEPDRREALQRLAAFVDALRADVKAKTDAIGAELIALRTGHRATEQYRRITRAAAEFDVKREM